MSDALRQLEWTVAGNDLKNQADLEAGMEKIQWSVLLCILDQQQSWQAEFAHARDEEASSGGKTIFRECLSVLSSDLFGQVFLKVLHAGLSDGKCIASDLQLAKFAVTLKSSSTAFFDAASEAREIEDDDDGNALGALQRPFIKKNSILSSFHSQILKCCCMAHYRVEL